jgi:hypothetical protein
LRRRKIRDGASLRAPPKLIGGINIIPTSGSYGFRNKKFGRSIKFRLTARPENHLWVTVSTFLSPCMLFRETGFRKRQPVRGRPADELVYY